MRKVLACPYKFQAAPAPYLFAVEAVSRMSECCQEGAGSPQEGGTVGAAPIGATRYRGRERQALLAGAGNLALALRGGQRHRRTRAPLLHIWSPAMASVISQLLQFGMTSPSWKTDFLVTECGSPSDWKCEFMLSQTVPMAKLCGEGVL